MSKPNEGIKIDEIIRSKRKTISMEVMRDGSLIIRAPYLTTQSQIEALVQSKESWIRKKQDLVRVSSQEAPPRNFVAGELYWYLGKLYPLELVDNQDEPLTLKDKFYLDESFQNKGLLVFSNWYKKRATEVIKTQVKLRAQENGFSYSRVRITSAKTRWGSCSSKGSLNFTWRLVMAPSEVIDYVVVHELTHLIIRNHSNDYWNEVGKVMPDYDQYRKWLKENGHRLTLE